MVWWKWRTKVTFKKLLFPRNALLIRIKEILWKFKATNSLFLKGNLNNENTQFSRLNYISFRLVLPFASVFLIICYLVLSWLSNLNPLSAIVFSKCLFHMNTLATLPPFRFYASSCFFWIWPPNWSALITLKLSSTASYLNYITLLHKAMRSEFHLARADKPHEQLGHQ